MRTDAVPVAVGNRVLVSKHQTTEG